jgi:hypothetical protein
LRRWRPQRLVLLGTRGDHAYRRVTDEPPTPHDARLESAIIRRCAGLDGRRLLSLDMHACTVLWNTELLGTLSRLTALHTLRVESDTTDPADAAVTDAAVADAGFGSAGFATVLQRLAPSLTDLEVTLCRKRATLEVLRDSRRLRSLRIGRALWTEAGTKLEKKGGGRGGVGLCDQYAVAHDAALAAAARCARRSAANAGGVAGIARSRCASRRHLRRRRRRQCRSRPRLCASEAVEGRESKSRRRRRWWRR